MLTAHDKNNNIVYAEHSDKSGAPFCCPECRKEVILKRGHIKIAHFAHKPPTNCIYAYGETHTHLIAKMEIYRALVDHEGVTKCAIERRLNGVRPDISLYIGRAPIAIEVQHSSIDIDEICRRTVAYTRLGMHTLWVIPDDMPGQEGDEYRIHEWEKYLYSLYFGRLYYWAFEATVVPCHFDSVYRYVEEAYNRHGEPVGGYDRALKSTRSINMGRSAHIVRDFKPTTRSELASRNWSIPASKIWIDTQKKWW